VARDGSGRWWPRGQRPEGLPARAHLHLTTCVLTVAHLNHNHEDNRDENLAALCQRCHLAHDQRFHYANRRRTEAARRHQSWLSPELVDILCDLVVAVDEIAAPVRFKRALADARNLSRRLCAEESQRELDALIDAVVNREMRGAA
jgi:hypothetical protein